MKKIIQFSRQKFLSLDRKKQIRKLLEFIKEIDRSDWNSKKYEKPMYEFLKVLYYLHSANSELITHFKFAQNVIKRIKTKKFHQLIEQTSYRDFLEYILPFLHEFGSAQTDADFLSSLPDGLERTERDILPIYLILNNLRSAFNVGSIMRSAECIGVEKLFFTGYTPTPQNSNVKKTAMGTENHIDWQKCDSIKELMNNLKSNDVTIYALESNPKADIISQVEWGENIAILVGNEALGIPEELLKTVDKIVNIPLRGWKNSLNVGVATAICLYEIQKSFPRKQ